VVAELVIVPVPAAWGVSALVAVCRTVVGAEVIVPVVVPVPVAAAAGAGPVAEVTGAVALAAVPGAGPVAELVIVPVPVAWGVSALVAVCRTVVGAEVIVPVVVPVPVPVAAAAGAGPVAEVTGAAPDAAAGGAKDAACACRENPSNTAKIPAARIAACIARRAMCRKIGWGTSNSCPVG
jgi:hypothetical protein